MVTIVDTDKARKTLKFFKELIHSLVDTYLLTLLAIEQINGKPMVLPIRKLIRELHATAKDLYTEGQLPDLHSCLMEVIQTSLRRFEKMGFITMRSFTSKKGSMNTFIQSPP
jgi:hypothetical protein